MNAAEVEALIETDPTRFWEEVQKLPSEYDRLRLVVVAVKLRTYLKREAAYRYLAKLEPRLAELVPQGTPFDVEKLKNEGKIT